MNTMQRNRLKVICKFLQKVFAVCFLLSIAGAGMLYYEQQTVKEQMDHLLELREAAQAEKMTDQEPQGQFVDRNVLAELNDEYLGWLTVYGTEVDLPVVFGRDNEYYLDHDFYGNISRYGCLFADCDTDFEDGGNLLIYGHHMKNGSMFGSLGEFKKKDFFKNHGLIRWEQDESIAYYEIFSVLVVPGYEEDENYFPIRNYLTDLDQKTTAKLIKELKNRAFLWRDVEILDTDRFLFLMTCDYTRTDGRLLLCAKCLN